MTDDEEDYLDLPEDPEHAFVALAKRYRDELDRLLHEADGHSPVDQYRADYIDQVAGAADELGLDQFSNYVSLSDGQSNFEVFISLSSKVLRFSTRINIRQSRRRKNYSVPLDATTRTKIKHHLDNVLEVVRKLEITKDKRDAIIAKVVALLSEIEKPRTGLEVLGALTISTATTLGEAADKLEPVRKLIDSVARLLGRAKESDVNNPALPAPMKPKQIEAPKDVPSADAIDNDDIPF